MTKRVPVQSCQYSNEDDILPRETEYIDPGFDGQRDEPELQQRNPAEEIAEPRTPTNPDAIFFGENFQQGSALDNNPLHHGNEDWFKTIDDILPRVSDTENVDPVLNVRPDKEPELLERNLGSRKPTNPDAIFFGDY
jgi:hypothetical protein